MCPACGISQDCQQLFAELSGYTVTRGGPAFIHQHALDAFTTQHAALAARTIGPAFGLIGLYLLVEKNFTGRQVQRAHMDLVKRQKVWPKLAPPTGFAALTILDVLEASEGELRDEAILKWAAAVWDSWGHAHAWARGAYETLMAGR
jgi:hypothetical protein